MIASKLNEYEVKLPTHKNVDRSVWGTLYRRNEETEKIVTTPMLEHVNEIGIVIAKDTYKALTDTHREKTRIIMYYLKHYEGFLKYRFFDSILQKPEIKKKCPEEIKENIESLMKNHA